VADAGTERAVKALGLALAVGGSLLPCHTALAKSPAREARAGTEAVKAGNRSERVDDFIARVTRIKAKIGDLTWTGGLLGVEDFREIHAHPQTYLDAALRALEGTALGDEEKIIVALSMQKLPLPELVRFSEGVLSLLEAGRVSETVFQHAVFPTYDWNTALPEDFADSGVQRLLQRVLDSPSVNARRKEIVKDEILTGNAQKDVLELREAGEIK